MSGLGFTGVAGNSPELPGRRPAPSFIGSAVGVFDSFFEWFGSLGIFSWRVLRAAVTPPYEWRELIRQLDEVGSKSLPLVAMAGAAIGVVVSLEATGDAAAMCAALPELFPRTTRPLRPTTSTPLLGNALAPLTFSVPLATVVPPV